MPNPQKDAAVAELQELLSKSSAVILADYRGLNVAQMNELRRKMREANAEFHVAKNTLTRIASKAAGIEGLDSYLEGPTAIAVSFGDPTVVAKVINDFARSTRILSVKAGVLEHKVISAEAVNDLANIEPREVLLGKVVGGLNAPIANLVGVLNAAVASIAYVLQARIDQLGGVPAEAAG